MRLVRCDVEPIWARYYPGDEPEGFEPYDTGWTAVKGHIVLNPFETRLLCASQAVRSWWFETVTWRAGRIVCRVFGRHNVSCHGRYECAREIARAIDLESERWERDKQVGQTQPGGCSNTPSSGE